MNNDYSQHASTSGGKTLKQRIMRRVYLVFMARNLAPFAFDCLALVILVFAVRLFVSVRHVFANLFAAQSSGNLSHFSFSAVSHTEIETKLLLVVLGVIGFFALRHLRRAAKAVKILRQGDREGPR